MATKKKPESLLTDRVIAWFHLDQESCGISLETREYLIRAAIGIERTFQQQNVQLTPILELRVIDVLTQAMVSREMQGAITQDGIVVEEPAPEPKANDPEPVAPATPRPRKLNPMVEHQAKCWDRLRKATDTFEKSF
ncbi:MAG: hypothetical protein GY851_11840, partial [bacterium]|nr:hypothetical protein [bacterium]